LPSAETTKSKHTYYTDIHILYMGKICKQIQKAFQMCRIPKYTVFINQTQKKYLDGAFFALKFWSVRPQESHYICK